MKLSELTGSSNRVKLSQVAPAGLTAQGNPKIEKSEGLLKRAMGIGQRTVQAAVTPQSSGFDPQHPFLSSLGAVSGFENVPGLGALQSAERARGSVIEDAAGPGIGSTVLNIATDPLTWLGGGGVGKAAIKAAGGTAAGKGVVGASKAVRDVLNPVKASGEIGGAIKSAGTKMKSEYGTGLQNIVSKYKGKTTSFIDILDNPKTLAEQRVFNAVKDEASFQKLDLGKLSAEESKKVMDIVKDKVGAISKGEVGATEITTEKALRNLKSRQLEDFPDFSQIDKPYGLIEDYRDLSGKEASILEGGGNRILKSAQMQKLKNLDKEAFKRSRNYRRANIVVKTAKNPLVRAGAAVPIVGGLLKALFGKS